MYFRSLHKLELNISKKKVIESLVDSDDIMNTTFKAFKVNTLCSLCYAWTSFISLSVSISIYLPIFLSLHCLYIRNGILHRHEWRDILRSKTVPKHLIKDLIYLNRNHREHRVFTLKALNVVIIRSSESTLEIWFYLEISEDEFIRNE